MKNSIDNILKERGENYGKFEDNSRTAQMFKMIARMNSDHWLNLNDEQREAIDMILHKLSRIIHGNPDYVDSWSDIIGYATLIEESLTKTEN